MFWTLVVMTIGGTPIPTDLVFDSIDACYEAEEQMVAERSRYAREWMGRSPDNHEMPEFVRQNLMRGACIPHVPTAKTDNLPKEKLKVDPGRMYPFTERARTGSGPAAGGPSLQVFIAARPDYSLPKVQLSFRFIIRNPGDAAVRIRNPLQNFFLTFQRPDGFPIEMPRRVPDLIADRRGPASDLPLRGPSHVEFRTAFVNGKKDKQERNIYSIDPESSLELVFECENVIGEKILAAMKDLDTQRYEQYVDVSALMSLMYPDSSSAPMLQLDEKIRLPIPKP